MFCPARMSSALSQQCVIDWRKKSGILAPTAMLQGLKPRDQDPLGQLLTSTHEFGVSIALLLNLFPWSTVTFADPFRGSWTVAIFVVT